MPETKENDKKRDDAKKLRSLQLTERGVDYIKTPLLYETTGGFGKEANKWSIRSNWFSARITATRARDSGRAGL